MRRLRSVGFNMRSKTDIKKCGTCHYWTGKRIPVFDEKGNPKVDIFDIFGVCENENSKRFCGAVRDQRLNCKHYSKWTELF